MFVNGLAPVVKTLVKQPREETHRMNYLDLLQYARAEGESNRARLSASPRRTPMHELEIHSQTRGKPRRWAENDKVIFAESTADSRESHLDANQPQYTCRDRSSGKRNRENWGVQGVVKRPRGYR